jgi:AcrR family transcriptional regulator
MAKETYIPSLMRLFRQYGYDGATLSKISIAAGLGKASLYHHFPGGKDEMVEAMLDYLECWLEQNILQTLNSPDEPLFRLQHMCDSEALLRSADRVNEVYEGGKQPCLFAISCSPAQNFTFVPAVRSLSLVYAPAS